MTNKSHSEENSELSQANKSDVPVYELGFHLVPTVQDDGVAAVVEKVRAALADAEIISEQFPARMTLSYVIERSVQGKREKYAESYFGFIKFAMERGELAAFQTMLRGTHEVLRFLIIETVREDAPAPRRTVFTSNRLEGETIKKPEAVAEKPAGVSQEELDKTIDALVSQE